MKELTEIKLDDPFFSTLLRQKAARTATKKIKRILLKIDEPNRSGQGKFSLSSFIYILQGEPSLSAVSPGRGQPVQPRQSDDSRKLGSVDRSKHFLELASETDGHGRYDNETEQDHHTHDPQHRNYQGEVKADCCSDS